MRRTITGFHQDVEGDWVAELDCLHGQHVRHRPPIWPRPWTLTEAGRGGRIGTVLDCPLCDRAELPQGLTLVRTAGPFDEVTLPAGLRRPHRVAAATWGRLHVRAGSARLRIDTDPPLDVRLGAGDRQPIPPEVAHRLELGEGAVVEVELLVRADPGSDR